MKYCYYISFSLSGLVSVACCVCVFCVLGGVLDILSAYIYYTWSYSEEPGYKGQPKNSSAITQPRDHMSMASQNGRPSRISGALKGDKQTSDY